MIKAVVFDLDDTLYCERDYVLSGFRAVAQALGRNAQEENTIHAMLKKLFDSSGVAVFDRFVASRPGCRLTATQMTQIYREHTPVIQPFPDVVPCLKALKSAGLKTGIVTDGTPTRQRAKIAALNLGDYFDSIVVTDELGGEQFRKPCLAAFEHMQKELKIPLQALCYVGDNPEKDFYVGQSKVFTVRILRENRIHKTENYYLGITERLKIQSLDELVYKIKSGGYEQCP